MKLLILFGSIHAWEGTVYFFIYLLVHGVLGDSDVGDLKLVTMYGCWR